MAYKKYYQLVTIKYDDTTIKAVCFTQSRTCGVKHGLDKVTINYDDGVTREHDRKALGLPPFTINWCGKVQEVRKYDNLLFSVLSMLFNRMWWDTKEHYKQLMNTIENGTRTYKDMED